MPREGCKIYQGLCARSADVEQIASAFSAKILARPPVGPPSLPESRCNNNVKESNHFGVLTAEMGLAVSYEFCQESWLIKSTVAFCARSADVIQMPSVCTDNILVSKMCRRMTNLVVSDEMSDIFGPENEKV